MVSITQLTSMMQAEDDSLASLNPRIKKQNDDDNIDALLAEAESIKDNASAYLPVADLAVA